MSNYWVYEDMTVHTATVHRGECRYSTTVPGWDAAGSRGIAGGSGRTTRLVGTCGLLSRSTRCCETAASA